MLENPNDARCDMYGAWGMWQSLFFQRKYHENEMLSIILGSWNVTNVCCNCLLVTYRSYHRKSNFRRTIYSTPLKPKFLFVTFFGTPPPIAFVSHGSAKKTNSPIYLSKHFVLVFNLRVSHCFYRNSPFGKTAFNTITWLGHGIFSARPRDNSLSLFFVSTKWTMNLFFNKIWLLLRHLKKGNLKV
jgi:hypothetical protein